MLQLLGTGRGLLRTGRLSGDTLRDRLGLAIVSPHTYGGSLLRNEISGRHGTFQGSGTKPTWDGKQAVKIAGGTTAGASYVDFTTDPQVQDLGISGNTGFTIWARVWLISTSVQAIAERNDNNSVNAGWMFAANGLTIEASAVNMRTVVANAATGKWINFCAVHDGTQTSSAQKFYTDAVLTTHSSDTNGSGTRGSDATNSLFVGRNSFTSGLAAGDLDGYIESLYVWKSRQLSQHEIYSLQTDPYRMFRDRATSFFFLARTDIGTGLAQGTSTVTGEGRSTATGTGSAAGTCTVSGIAPSIVTGVGTAAGTSTVTAVGTNKITGVGTAAGTCTVAAGSASLGAGSAAGSCTVLGRVRNASVNYNVVRVIING